MKTKFRRNEPITDEGRVILQHALNYCDAQAYRMAYAGERNEEDSYMYAGNYLYGLLKGDDK